MPPLYIATLACGLRDGSRVVSELNNAKISLDTMLKASISDSLKNLVWMNSEDGRKNQNRPKLILPILLGMENENESQYQSFNSLAEFEEARRKLINGEK